MAAYVYLNGVCTWYDEQGAGKPLVLFHPGGVGVDSQAFGPNLQALSSHFRVLLPERRGHGHSPDTDDPYSYDLMADDMILFLEQVVGGPARLLGMSDGAIVALTVAVKRPDLVQRLICVGGVFHNAGWAEGVINPDPEPPDFLIGHYGDVSPDGEGHFAVVAEKLNQMHSAGPKFTTDDLKKIHCRTLVMVGDDDEVMLEHAIDFYRGLPEGELAIVPGTSHGLLVEKPELCNQIIVDFLTSDPVPTLAPIRRAPA
ncbi:alpha/beta fold hydrolase [Streptomyces sp. CA-251387]|uniref:alpha/beta fold hydrolase n=1 Tax=Streptomyces sp. CA-251387 TaxID=3240064 RepID=UPI003D942FF5